MRQIQGKEPVDRSRLVVLRAVAGAQRAQWPAMPVFAGVALINLGNLLLGSWSVGRAVGVSGLAVMAVGLPLSLWQVRLASRFLRDHPEPEAHPTEP